MLTKNARAIQKTMMMWKIRSKVDRIDISEGLRFGPTKQNAIRLKKLYDESIKDDTETLNFLGSEFQRNVELNEFGRY